ncbi:MAG: tol-pal system protein YbgF [Wenzhouxiangella sp.]|nr:tol-pal system protein YbgF [Wenzhouxiangella sp.]
MRLSSLRTPPRIPIKAAAYVAALMVLSVCSPAWAQQDNADSNARTEMVYQLQTLLEEVRALRGQVESQQVEIENLRKRQRDQYLDLDRRLQALGRQSLASDADQDGLAPPQTLAREDSSAGSSTDTPAGTPIDDGPEVRPAIDTTPEVMTLAPPSSGGGRSLEPASDQEQAQYDQAFQALKAARYADAAQQFSAFVDAYPNSSYAPNAFYWLAETYYVTEDFETAAVMFANVLERYPNSSKSGDALLKLGFSHFALEQWVEARSALEQVKAEHPDTTLARLAEGRLRDMRLSGRF